MLAGHCTRHPTLYDRGERLNLSRNPGVQTAATFWEQHYNDLSPSLGGWPGLDPQAGDLITAVGLPHARH